MTLAWPTDMRPLDSVSRAGAQHPARSRFARHHPRAYLGMHGLVGLALALLSAWGFAAIADAVPESPRMIHADTTATAWLQVHGTETGEAIFAAIGWLGSQLLVVVTLAIALALLGRRSWRRFAFVAVSCAGAWILSVILKPVFHRARPTFASEFVSNGSYSFPSGHALESIVVYGVVGYLLVERFPSSARVVGLGWVGLAGLIGFSRLYLGVHYPSDVVAGFAAGLVWLFTCITGYRFAEDRNRGRESEREGLVTPSRRP